MKKKSLILITSQSLNKWNYSRFNLFYLKKKFYIKYWNISPITSSVSLIKKEKHKEITVKEKKFFSYFELIKAINKLKKNTYVIDISSDKSLIYILIKNLLYLKGIKFIYVSIGNYIETGNKRRFSTFFKKIFKKYFITSNIRRRIYKLYNLFKFFKYDYYFVGGLSEQRNIKEKSKIIYSHALDFNKMLELKDAKRPLAENYIVYLDQKILDHPEYELTLEPNYLDKMFYKYLKNFFEDLSKIQKKKIIFCAHPRAQSNDDYLKNFKNVVFNKTAIYSKYADLVVAHDSISINFPILFNKPILLLQMPGRELTNFKDNLDLMGKVLGCKVIDIKKYKKKELNKFYQVDQQKYKKYIQQFIKFRGENKNSWEILAGKIL